MRDRTVYQSITKKTPITATPQTTVYDAACRMTAANCGSIVVVDDNGVMLGIMTERDLMIKVVSKSLSPTKTPISKIMSSSPRFARPEMPVADAVMIMKEGGFRHLPIISETSELLGVFSIRDASPYELIDAEGQLESLDKVYDSLGY